MNRHQRDDRGAVLIIVSVFMLVAVVMVAAVVDLGNQRSEKKVTTLATDSAALAAASAISFVGAAPGSESCVDVVATDTRFGPKIQHLVDHYLQLNGQPQATFCQVEFPTARSAFVTVSVSNEVEYQVGSTSSGSVSGTSSARVSLGGSGGLYPIGLCTNQANLGGESIKEMLNGADERSYPVNAPGNLGLQFGNMTCGVSGSFSQIDFGVKEANGLCKEEGQFCFDLINGYGVRPLPRDYVENNPGNDWGSKKIEPKVDALVGKRIWLPAFDNGVGGGSPGTFAITHFVEAEIRNWDPKTGIYFDVFRIVPFNLAGPPATSESQMVRAHLCGTGQGTDACTGTEVAVGPEPTTTTTTTTTTTASTTTTTTTTTTTVPPSTTTTTRPACVATGATVDPSNNIKARNSKFDEAFTVTVTVNNAGACAGMTVAVMESDVVKVSTTTTVQVGTTNSRRASFPVESGTGVVSQKNYDVRVTSGASSWTFSGLVKTN